MKVKLKMLSDITQLLTMHFAANLSVQAWKLNRCIDLYNATNNYNINHNNIFQNDYRNDCFCYSMVNKYVLEFSILGTLVNNLDFFPIMIDSMHTVYFSKPTDEITNNKSAISTAVILQNGSLNDDTILITYIIYLH